MQIFSSFQQCQQLLRTQKIYQGTFRGQKIPKIQFYLLVIMVIIVTITRFYIGLCLFILCLAFKKNGWELLLSIHVQITNNMPTERAEEVEVEDTYNTYMGLRMRVWECSNPFVPNMINFCSKVNKDNAHSQNIVYKIVLLFSFSNCLKALLKFSHYCVTCFFIWKLASLNQQQPYS